MRILILIVLLSPQLVRFTSAQSIENWAPKATLQEFAESLAVYDRVLIDISVAQKESWRDEIAHLTQAIPIRAFYENKHLSLNKIEITLDLKRKGERGITFHEEFSVSYRRNSNEFSAELRNPLCVAASIKQKARFGIFWSSLPTDEIEHGCLRIAPRKITFPQVIALVVESFEQGSEEPISVGRRASIDTVAQTAATALGLPAIPGNYIVFESSELFRIDNMSEADLERICGIFANGESSNANDRISQFVSKAGTRIGVIPRDAPANHCIRLTPIPVL